MLSAERLEKITIEVTKLAKETGAFIKNELRNFDTAKIEYKGSKDMVSYVDKESEKKIVAGLSKIFPEAGFITEEGTVKKEEKEFRWIIDPLDGTTNFLHGLPTFSVSIALLHAEAPIIGVVYEPNLDECFYAFKSGGAFCNGKKIQVSSIGELNKSLVATGFPYSLLNREEEFFKILQEFTKTTHGLRRLGSAAVDLAYVACGRFEAYFEFNLKIWDIAAGILIVQEAGGKVSDFEGGNDYLYGKEVIAAGNLHPEILRVIGEFWSK